MANTFTVTLDGETETYEMLIAGLTFAEARAVEKATGISFQEIATPQAQGRTEVLQALLWVSMKRRHPTLTFSDLDDVAIDSIEWEVEEDATEAAPFEDGPDASASASDPALTTDAVTT